MIISVFDRVENIVEKGEIACISNFSFFPQCLKRLLFQSQQKVSLCGNRFTIFAFMYYHFLLPLHASTKNTRAIFSLFHVINQFCSIFTCKQKQYHSLFGIDTFHFSFVLITNPILPFCVSINNTTSFLASLHYHFSSVLWVIPFYACLYMALLNPLLDNRILGFPKLKAFADDKLNVTQGIKLSFIG